MTDSEMRDMLVLAARAAGLNVVSYVPGQGSSQPALLIERGPGQIVRWNAWANDGDAFRLLVWCGLQGINTPLMSDGEAARATAASVTVGLGGGSPTRRMRRAVVRAARDMAEAANLSSAVAVTWNTVRRTTPARKRGAA